MKITIEVPDTTNCAFLNYLYEEGSRLIMGCRSLTTNEINSGEVIVCAQKLEGKNERK